MTDPQLLRDYTARTGRVICQICTEPKTLDELEPVSAEPGNLWDVCITCAAREKERGDEEFW